MSEASPDTTVNVEGDAVVNQAPNGGGVDNTPPVTPEPATEGAKTLPGDTETSI